MDWGKKSALACCRMGQDTSPSFSRELCRGWGEEIREGWFKVQLLVLLLLHHPGMWWGRGIAGRNG